MKIDDKTIIISFKHISIFILALLTPSIAQTATRDYHEIVDLTDSVYGYAAIAIFIIAYLMVMCEECMHLRKSKPVMLAAGLIWGMLGYYYSQHGMAEVVEVTVRHNLLEYAELMLFLLVAMTYVNALEERQVFNTLRCLLVSKGFGYRQLFWLTGILTFFISPIADNLTTSLLMCAVVIAVGGDNMKFINLACINIVVAANAGGAFSPFGDITTLMVWQKGIVDFWTFFTLFIPALVNAVVPAAIMHFAIPQEKPSAIKEEIVLHRGAKRIMLLFLLTIVTAVCFHNFLGLPPVIGMLTGLSYLQFMGYYLKITHFKHLNQLSNNGNNQGELGDIVAFDIFKPIARAEWDTLLFFYGVVLCVGGLGFIGYLAMISDAMYIDWGPTTTNIAIGVVSAIIDNIPIMFSVLTMNPEMSLGQWLLVTLTAGVGGSLLSIGSAAGVALMGQSQGKYTFFGHLKWTPVIALGYIASIATHMWINSGYF